jgi:RNA polymerase sigma-70 factor (ECF subfamily)
MMSDERAESGVAGNDDELVVRAKYDCAAFSQLYRRYYPEIATYCLRRLQTRAVAEDVVSEVFLNVASHLPGFAGVTETEFRRWIFRIATNAITTYWRQFRLRQQLLVQAASNGRLHCTGGQTETSDVHRWEAVHQAVMELEERDRSIVMLRFFSNCSHDEIAEIVDATPGAVRTALSRILARLREKLNTA